MMINVKIYDILSYMYVKHIYAHMFETKKVINTGLRWISSNCLLHHFLSSATPEQIILYYAQSFLLRASLTLPV